MSLSDRLLETLSVSFFLICLALILHLIFYSPGSKLGRETFFIALANSLARLQVDAFYFFSDKSFSELPFGIELGGLVGALAGCYVGFATFVFDGFGNENERKESALLNGLSVAIGASVSEVGRFLAPYLMPVQRALSELFVAGG